MILACMLLVCVLFCFRFLLLGFQMVFFFFLPDLGI